MKSGEQRRVGYAPLTRSSPSKIVIGYKSKNPEQELTCSGFLYIKNGGDLLSPTVSHAVPSALGKRPAGDLRQSERSETPRERMVSDWKEIFGKTNKECVAFKK